LAGAVYSVDVFPQDGISDLLFSVYFCCCACITEGFVYERAYRWGGVVFFFTEQPDLRPEGTGVGAARCRPSLMPHGWSHETGTGKPRP
jgi:hypothetical protein